MTRTDGVGGIATFVLLLGCVAPQDANPLSYPAPGTSPEARTIDAIEVKFGSDSRLISDRSRIEGSCEFLNSLDSDWQEDPGIEFSGGAVWQMFVKSDGRDEGCSCWTVMNSPG